MKKLVVIVMAFFLFASGVLANVSEKILTSFNNVFPSAENSKWTEDKHGYFVSFTQFGILTKVAYNHRGDFQYALRYYKEENLPISILMNVREKFEIKKIFGVVEVSTTEDVEYYIKLEDTKNIYGIMVTSGGDVTVKEQFERNDL
jgi:hypothetical protein